MEKNCAIKYQNLDLPDDIVEIARIAKAMSHPVRIYILKKLAKMNSCFYSGNLVEELPICRSTLSKHLKELKMAGLIKGEINSPYIKYCIDRENWERAKAKFIEFFNQDVNINSNKIC